MTIQDQLRKVCEEIRRKPYPIKDLIPMIHKAIDSLDSLEKELGYWEGVTERAEKLNE